MREARRTEITLRQPETWQEPLGTLQINRYTKKARSREILFYELTWVISSGRKTNHRL